MGAANSNPDDAVNGIVLKSTPVGEYDRRVVLLTAERGKISCFARGARRQNSHLMGPSTEMTFGRFVIRSGKSSNVMVDAEIVNYFGGLRSDMDACFYGMYFLEVMDYITRENNDEAMLLKLLYVCLRALEKPSVPRTLVRAVFELKCVVIEGEFREPDDRTRQKLLPDTVYAMLFIASAPPEKLFSFTLSDEVLSELVRFSRKAASDYFRHSFKSAELLDVL